jgi:hypothetical protein
MCRLAATDETAHTPPTRTRTRPARHARVRPPAPTSASRQSTAAWSTRRPTRSLRGGQQRLQHRPLRVRQVEPPRHRCGVREVTGGLRFFLVDEPLPENSLILDHRHAQPASPSCPLEPCGVRTYFADDLAGSGLTLRARRGRCWRRIDEVGHREVGRFSGIRLAVAGADP